MTETEHIAQLLAELGSASPDLAEVRQAGADLGLWALAYDDGLRLTLEHDAERRTLSLSAGLGMPPADRADAVRECLLVYSSLWRRTGVSAAQGEAGGEPLLFSDLDAREPSLPWLQAVVENFANKARVWRAVVAAGAPDNGMNAGDEAGDRLLANAVLV